MICEGSCQIDLIPDKWVSLLEGEGYKFYDVPAEPIGWLDGTPRFHVNRVVDLSVEVVGLAGGPLLITFYVCKENFDELIIGWRSLVRCNLHSRILEHADIVTAWFLWGYRPPRSIFSAR